MWSQTWDYFKFISYSQLGPILKTSFFWMKPKPKNITRMKKETLKDAHIYKVYYQNFLIFPPERYNTLTRKSPRLAAYEGIRANSK